MNPVTYSFSPSWKIPCLNCFFFFLIKKLACVDCNSDMTQNREEKEVKMLLYPWAEMYSSQYGRDTYFTGYAHRNLNCTAARVLNATSTEYIKWLPEKQGMFHSCVTSLVNWKQLYPNEAFDNIWILRVPHRNLFVKSKNLSNHSWTWNALRNSKQSKCVIFYLKFLFLE